MILSDKTIRERVVHWNDDRRIGIEPFDGACVQPASVDLHLAPTILEVVPEIIAEERVVDVLAPDETIWREATIGPEGYVLGPGECILAATVETVQVPPDLGAELWGKSSRARLFLMIHATAGYADPGFRGKWTLEIKNLFPLPLRLHAGMKIAQMRFTALDCPCERGYGSPELGSHYQNQGGATPSGSDV